MTNSVNDPAGFSSCVGWTLEPGPRFPCEIIMDDLWPYPLQYYVRKKAPGEGAERTTGEEPRAWVPKRGPSESVGPGLHKGRTVHGSQEQSETMSLGQKRITLTWIVGRCSAKRVVPGEA